LNNLDVVPTSVLDDENRQKQKELEEEEEEQEEEEEEQEQEGEGEGEAEEEEEEEKYKSGNWLLKKYQQEVLYVTECSTLFGSSSDKKIQEIVRLINENFVSFFGTSLQCVRSIHEAHHTLETEIKKLIPKLSTKHKALTKELWNKIHQDYINNQKSLEIIEAEFSNE